MFLVTMMRFNNLLTNQFTPHASLASQELFSFVDQIVVFNDFPRTVFVNRFPSFVRRAPVVQLITVPASVTTVQIKYIKVAHNQSVSLLVQLLCIRIVPFIPELFRIQPFKLIFFLK